MTVKVYYYKYFDAVASEFRIGRRPGTLAALEGLHLEAIRESEHEVEADLIDKDGFVVAPAKDAKG